MANQDGNEGHGGSLQRGMAPETTNGGIRTGASSRSGDHQNSSHAGQGTTQQQQQFASGNASSGATTRGARQNTSHASAAQDQDVPSWDLDMSRRISTESQATARTSAGAQAQGNSSSAASSPTSTRIYRGGRPLHTQLTEDVDGLNHGHEPDQEVDGDGHGFVLHQRQEPNGSGASSDPVQSSDAVPVQSQRRADYSFPRHRLPLQMRDESKVPLIIVACGSFSPPTYLHLRIFEMAKDQIIESGKYELLAGYYSPVSDHYRKAGLAEAKHRVRMCELAVEKTSTWLMVDAWESLQDEYQRTAVVLDHFNDEINGPIVDPGRPANNDSTAPAVPPQPERGVLLSNGRRRRVKIMLLAGGDLIQSMGEPGVWADADLHHILGRYGCMIVERTGADVWSFLLSHDLLWRYRRNLRVVKQTIYNDISSSKVRLFVRRGQSIKYLLPNSVIKYIENHGLYRLSNAETGGEDVGSAVPAPEDENW